jgi:hypothetical protein
MTGDLDVESEIDEAEFTALAEKEKEKEKEHEREVALLQELEEEHEKQPFLRRSWKGRGSTLRRRSWEQAAEVVETSPRSRRHFSFPPVASSSPWSRCGRALSMLTLVAPILLLRG